MDPDGERWCDTTSCGANSPTVNGFPLNGLRPNGDCNPDGVQLVPGSLLGGQGGNCTGATLSMADNQLVGLHPDGSLQCSANDLLGASFAVRSWVPVSKDNPQKLSARIRIAGIADYQVGKGEIRTSYRLVRADKPDGADTLCSANESNDLRESLGLKPIGGLAPSPPHGHDAVIPVDSELYDVDGRPIPIKASWRLQESEWINLACVHDALAKRSLYSLFTDNVERSRAALLMLTANYCGGKPFTMRGINVAWSSADSDVLEARWSSKQARCLSNPRILYKDGPNPMVVPPDLPDSLRKICDGDECKDVEAWKAAARICKVGKQPPTKLEICSPCPGDHCEPGLFDSFVVPGP